jgi:hypothetical protein
MMMIKATGRMVMIKNVRRALISRLARAGTEGRVNRPSALSLILVVNV